ncbi:MAG: hypothetical protein CME35_01255, partial [Gramella sp.]|nr:hypothetical protein [Christiangramia sp.]
MDIRNKKSIDFVNFLIDDLGFENAKQFSESLGLERPERIYKVQRGETKISKKLAEIINSKYPQYSIDDILIGKIPENKDVLNEETETYKPEGKIIDDKELPEKEVFVIPIKGRGGLENAFYDDLAIN